MTKKGGNKKTPARKPAPSRARHTVDAKANGAITPTEVHPQQSIIDTFSNQLARIGFGTNSLLEAGSYPTTRLSLNYVLLLSLWRDSWIARNCIEIPNQDAMKNWVEIQTELPPEEIDRFNDVINETGTKEQLLDALNWGSLFGGAAAVIIIKGQEDELDEPLDLESIEPDSYRGLIVFDRWSGVSPDSNISVDIDNPRGFGLPSHYLIQPEQGTPYRVHHSRILRFIGKKVPRWEVQVQSWWGISELELIFDDLRKRDTVSWSIANLVLRSNIWVIKDQQIAALVSGLGITGEAATRAYSAYRAMNEMMSNQGLLALTKDGGLENHQVSFAGLSEVETQFQLNLCGATKIPMTRLWGRTATGLGQSNEGDEGIYNDRIRQKQTSEISPLLTKLFRVVAMSTWGKIPRDLKHQWAPIQAPSNKEKADLGKQNADAICAPFNLGIYGRKTTLKELKQQSDITGLFSNITTDMINEASDEIAPDKSGEMPDGGGLEALMGGKPGEKEPEEGAEGEEQEPLQKMIAATEPAKRLKLIEGMLATIKGRGAEGGQGAGGEAGATVKIHQPRPTSGGNSRDAMPIQLREGQIARLDPRKLVFRKYNLNKMHTVSQRFASGIDLPITVIQRPNDIEILDGAHRVAIAEQYGWRNVPGAPISGEHYDELREAGFDDEAISYAVLQLAGHPETALLEAAEKPEQPVESEGMKALMALREMLKPKPVEDEMDVGEIPTIPEINGAGEANVGVEVG